MKNIQKILAKLHCLWYKYFENFSLWDTYTHFERNRRKMRTFAAFGQALLRQQRGCRNPDVSAADAGLKRAEGQIP